MSKKAFDLMREAIAHMDQARSHIHAVVKLSREAQKASSSTTIGILFAIMRLVDLVADGFRASIGENASRN